MLKRKNILMDQRKLDVAKAALGVETETAVVDAALDLVVASAAPLPWHQPSRRPPPGLSRQRGIRRVNGP